MTKREGYAQSAKQRKDERRRDAAIRKAQHDNLSTEKKLEKALLVGKGKETREVKRLRSQIEKEKSRANE